MLDYTSMAAVDGIDTRDVVNEARRLFAAWNLDALPAYLRRNGEDYYYLSVWPGLTQLEDVRDRDLPPRPSRTEAAYVHIPFCSGRCHFCSYFLTVPSADQRVARIRSYISLLRDEVSIHADATEMALSYIYLGGGTPTLLEPADMMTLLDAVVGDQTLTQPLLGTIEAHPEFFDDHARMGEFLTVLSDHEVKRVSIGFETGDAQLLSSTYRRHGPEFLQEAICVLKERGFLVNVDLMYGLPGQTVASWVESLDAVIRQNPDSISTYCTFVDFGTRLRRDVRSRRVTLPSHEELQTQHIAAQLVLESSGYQELPNDFYAAAGETSASYRQEALPSDANSLAIGAGSYGYYSGVQYFNVFSFADYRDMLRARKAPIWRARALSAPEEFCRDIMFSLKNSPELNGELFEKRHGCVPWEVYPDIFDTLTRLDLVTVRGHTCRLTVRGRLVVEEIAMMFARACGEPGAAEGTPAEVRRMRRHNYAPTYGATN